MTENKPLDKKELESYDNWPLFKDEIKSAREWLKQQIKGKVNYEEYKLIDEAFRI